MTDINNNKNDIGISLADVIETLREELKLAEATRDETRPLIIEDIEVELQTVVTRATDVNGEATGKIEFKVFDFFKMGKLEAKVASKRQMSQATTQKIKLKLKPMQKTSNGEFTTQNVSAPQTGQEPTTVKNNLAAPVEN